MLVPSAVPPDRRLRLDGMRLEVLAGAGATDGAFGLLELELPPGAVSPMHCHTREDETLVVRAGAVCVRRQQGAPVVLRAGDSLRLPRRVPHRLECASEAGATVLVVLTPGGLEATLALAAARAHEEEPDPDDTAALLAGAGVSLLGVRG